MTMSSDSLKVSEVFESLQGEGPSVGAPCLFLRLAGCNLRCGWCDTPYSWDWERFDPQVEVHRVPIADLVPRLEAAPGRRVVITGGEPLAQQAGLEALLRACTPTLTVEVETNGTLMPCPWLLERVDQWNVSPKLAHSGESVARRLQPEVLCRLRGSGRAVLKLVVDLASVEEAQQLWQALDWPLERVVLMPLAATPEELQAQQRAIAEAALARGVRYGTRLHLQLWGARRGV